MSLIFGKYEKIRRIAQGGMGEVFLARQTGVMDRLAILKSLRADLAAAAAAERDAEPTPTDRSEPRARTREQVQRADAAVTEFRARVRTDIRSHAARGGEVTSDLVDTLTRTLDAAAAEVRRALDRL